MMTALFSDRAPKMIVLSFAIVACKASILPSQASTISINRSGSRGRFSGRSAMRETLAKNALNRQQKQAFQATLFGLLTAFRATWVQSNPATKTDSCVAVRTTAPS